MLIIKSTTKKGRAMIASTKNYIGYSLHDVYASYSNAKLNDWNECRSMCIAENGKNFHIISKNTFGFSVAWECPKGMRIETPKNSYLIQ